MNLLASSPDYITPTNQQVDSRSFTFNVNPTSASAVPEPTSMALLGVGALGMLGYRIRRRVKADAVVA